jgi:hypothetical protein
VHLYAKIKADPRVAPWLLNAMHHATTYGSDGTYQFFGLPSATTGAAVKQGWTCCFGGRAGFHSSGFINGDRYAVVILTSSAPSTYGRYAMDTITGVARRLLPSGTVDNPNERHPFGKFDSATAAPNRTVTLTGWAYDRDNVAASINVAIYDNGRSLGWLKTNRPRLDVNRALRIGGLHGFAVAIPNVPAGTHKYCVYGINIGPPGPNPLIQCRTIGVSGYPLAE